MVTLASLSETFDNNPQLENLANPVNYVVCLVFFIHVFVSLILLNFFIKYQIFPAIIDIYLLRLVLFNHTARNRNWQLARQNDDPHLQLSQTQRTVQTGSGVQEMAASGV